MGRCRASPCIPLLCLLPSLLMTPAGDALLLQVGFQKSQAFRHLTCDMIAQRFMRAQTKWALQTSKCRRQTSSALCFSGWQGVAACRRRDACSIMSIVRRRQERRHFRVAIHVLCDNVARRKECARQEKQAGRVLLGRMTQKWRSRHKVAISCFHAVRVAVFLSISSMCLGVSRPFAFTQSYT